MENSTLKPEAPASVFDALFDDQHCAANLTARADVMIAIRQKVDQWKLPQQAAARRLGITRPRLNDLLRGKIDKFSLDALIGIAEQAGYKVAVKLEDLSAA